MKVTIGNQVIEIQDSGAPRGERNFWVVALNGVEIYADYNGKKARQLFEDVSEAVRKVAPPEDVRISGDTLKEAADALDDIDRRRADRSGLSEEVRAVVEQPVQIIAVAVTREDDEEGLRLEWLLEGGISELELAGTVLFAMPEANDLFDDDRSAELYRHPQRPVVMPDRKFVGDLDGPFMAGIGASNKAECWNACIDEFKRLNP